MILSLLVQRIKEEQAKLALSGVQFPTSDTLATGVRAGQWQGLGMALKLIDELALEEDSKD